MSHQVFKQGRYRSGPTFVRASEIISGSNLGPNYLQILSADGAMCHQQADSKKYFPKQKHYKTTTVLPAKSDSNFMFCLQSY